jgi:hypothetical protein
MSSNPSRRITLLIIVLLGLWGFAEWRCWQLRHRLENLQATTVDIETVDDATGSVLSPWIGGIPGISSGDDYLPKVTISDASENIRRATIVLDRPLTLQISANGYVEQPLTLTTSSRGKITVRLKKR